MTSATLDRSAPSGRQECSVAAALDVVGERWSLLVVRELFLGSRRFTDIARYTGAPRDVLTARLRRLEELGVVTRVVAPGSRRAEYRLTPAGKDLRPVLLALKQWGDEHVHHRTMAPHWQHTCGEEFVPEVHCRACGDRLGHGALTPLP